jgi:hypothetical protein
MNHRAVRASRRRRTSELRIHFGAVLLTALVSTVAPTAAPLRAQIDSTILVGVHPGAAAQSTATGRMLVTLFPWNGKLYAGYGDYGANTGPIAIMAFHPATREFTGEWTANTEAIFSFRPIRGCVYVPSIDRKSYGAPGDFALLDANGVWSDRDCGSTTHAYDIVAFGDSDLFVVGSKDRRAAAFRSTDNGATWTLARTDTALSGKTDDFSRYYFAGVLNGKMYLQARDYSGSLHPATRVFDGTMWGEGPNLFPGLPAALGWKPEHFAGKLVYRTWAPGRSSRIFSFDGATAGWIGSMWAFDIAVENEYLYALVDYGGGGVLVKRTRDLIDWEQLARVPDSCRCLAILNGRVYLGTVASELLELVSPIPTRVDHPAASAQGFALSISPNPSTGHTTIGFAPAVEGASIQIVDLFGRAILERHDVSGGALSVDLRSAARGTYFVVVRCGGRRAFGKLLHAGNGM